MISAQLIAVGLHPEGNSSQEMARLLKKQLEMLDISLDRLQWLEKDPQQLMEAASEALTKGELVIFAGGLGHYGSAGLRKIILEGLQLPLQQDKEVAARIARFTSSQPEGMEEAPEEEWEELALFPDLAGTGINGEVWPSPDGVNSGFGMAVKEQCIVFLPAAQQVFSPMACQEMTQFLARVTGKQAYCWSMGLFGISKKRLELRLKDWMIKKNPAVVAYHQGAGVILRITAAAKTTEDAQALGRPAASSFALDLEDFVYAKGENRWVFPEEGEQALFEKLAEGKITFAAGEYPYTALGGLLERCPGLTACHAASSAPELEQEFGLSRTLLQKYGPESGGTAGMLAVRYQQQTGASYGFWTIAGDESAYAALTDGEHLWIAAAPYPSELEESDHPLYAARCGCRLFYNVLAARPGLLPGWEEPKKLLRGKSSGTGFLLFGEEGGDPFPVQTLEWEPLQPEKGSAKKIAIAIGSLCAAAALVVGGFFGFQAFMGQHARAVWAEIEQLYTVQPQFPQDYPADYLPQFAQLYSRNPEVCGWLTIPGTSISYPVTQGFEDSDTLQYYATRDFDRNFSSYGTLYLDYRGDVKFFCDQLVIYGSNPKDGQMFGTLTSYKELDYYREHPVVRFDSVYDEGEYLVMAVFYANQERTQGDIFNYRDFAAGNTERQFNRYVYEVQLRSLLDTGVDAEYGDQLLALSTPSEIEGADFVVLARKLREEEDYPDVAKASLAQEPLYPDRWYREKGEPKPETVFYAQLFPATTSEPETTPKPIKIEAASKPETIPPAPEDTATSPEPEQTTPPETTPPVTTPPATTPPATTPPATTPATTPETTPAASSSSSGGGVGAMRDSDKNSSSSGGIVIISGVEKDDGYEDDWGDDWGESWDDDDDFTAPDASGITLKVSSGGRVYSDDAYEILCQIVGAELGSTTELEALKAQAVAAYSYIRYANTVLGTTPSVAMRSNYSKSVEKAVAQVLGEGVYYRGSLAYTCYHATSGGQTQSSAEVWGGNYPYLVSVDSSIDENAPGYRQTKKISRSQVESLVDYQLSITLDGDPEDWFEVLTYTSGGYNDKMRVGNETKYYYDATGRYYDITGRVLREAVFGLRSAKFDVEYDSRNDQFIFTTYGYGHGVGMSQNGAILMARQGYDYVEILEHYFPGTTVK